MNVPKIAIKTAVRLVSANQRQFAYAYECDSQFDGGEFSGPALARAEGNSEQRIFHEVSERFGLSGDQLYWAAYEYQMSQDARFFDSLNKRTQPTDGQAS